MRICRKTDKSRVRMYTKEKGRNDWNLVGLAVCTKELSEFR